MARALRDPGLYQKLLWLTLFRAVTVTVLLGGTAVVGWQTQGQAEHALAPIYAIVIASYAATIAFGVLLRQRVALVATAYGQIVLDVAVAAVVVAITGRSESLFVLMFSLAVVNAAILLHRRGALVGLVLSIAAYLWVVGTEHPLQPARVFAHVAAFVATAVLAAYLSEQLRRTGERLAASESDLAAITALHETIVQSMNGGLLTLDPQRRVTFLNRAGEALTGQRLDAIRGQPAARTFPMFAERVARDELEYVNARGERLDLGYSSFPLQDRTGDEVGTAVIFQDLTHLRAMEEAVQRAERLADLGRVAAGLAHELRNPLGAMSGSIELLRADASDDQRRLMDIVLREASRLDGLVTQFLRFARPPPVMRSRVDLATLLGETLDVFSQHPAAAKVTLERGLAPAEVAGDPEQLRQVAWNLLINAAEALEGREGGRIVVRCQREPEGGASFEVADDGPGIAREELDRIFLPFHTTKARGTGLGLATVQRVVDAHGGAITLDTASGAGARFTVRLPPGEDGPPARAEPG
ncbi:MAG: ATP-binding protein [Anaeromyxobacter sp.]